jgi:hypothetical protein
VEIGLELAAFLLLLVVAEAEGGEAGTEPPAPEVEEEPPILVPKF